MSDNKGDGLFRFALMNEIQVWNKVAIYMWGLEQGCYIRNEVGGCTHHELS